MNIKFMTLFYQILLILIIFGCSKIEDLNSDGTEESNYPPIYIQIQSHGHTYGIKTSSGDFTATKLEKYTTHKDEILWLASETEKYSAKMSYQLNGEYSQDAVFYNESAHIETIHNSGHHIGGVHYHRYTLGEDRFWEEFTSDEDAEKGDIAFDDHVGKTNDLLNLFGEKVIRVDPAVGDLDNSLSKFNEYDISILPGGEAFSYSKWNIKPWNPFNKMDGTKLSEDLTSDRVSIMSYGQVGKDAPAGIHAVYASVEQLKRHFLMQLAEWREHERLGDKAKIWSFGIMTHPDQNADHRDHMTDMIMFLSEYVTSTTENGTPIAKFVTDKELAEILTNWKSQFPGRSSFDFDWENHRKFEAGEAGATAEEYPYKLEGITEGLFGSDFDSEIKTFNDSKVKIFKFKYLDSQLGPMNNKYQRGIAVCDEQPIPIFMAWSDAGEGVTIDFSSETNSTNLFIKNGETGEYSVALASNLTITETPILFSATKSNWETESSCWCNQNPSDSTCKE